MKQLIKLLLVIAVIQCAMVATVYWPEATLLAMMSTEHLVPFEPYLVDEIHIGDEQGNEAVLLNTGDHWILPDLLGLSVSPELIEKLLQGVIYAETGWPVATSVAARQRFQVTDYNFQRRLTLIGKGELLGTIYLGSSPGFRRVQARNSTQDAIFTIAFNSFDAFGLNSAWLDKRTLQIRSPISIASDNYRLYKQDNGWLSDAGGQPDARELDALLVALSSLQIDSVASPDLQQTLSIAVPEITLAIETAENITTFELFTLGERHFIHCSDHPLYFTLSAYDFDRFATLDSDRLQGSL